MSMRSCAVRVTIVWFNNSDRFQIYGIVHSYSSCPFLCALGVVEGEGSGLVFMQYWQAVSQPKPFLFHSADHFCIPCAVNWKWLALQNRKGVAVRLLVFVDAGTLAWIEKLKWSGLEDFLNVPRRPLYPPSGVATHNTGAFVQGYKNFVFYWILKAGHMVRG